MSGIGRELSGGSLKADSALTLSKAERESLALAEIRRALARSYPLIRPWHVSRIARRYRLKKFPPGLLVQGSPRFLGSGTIALVRMLFGILRRRHAMAHPLFSIAYYDLANPDVSASRVFSWLHYQVYGRVEGRSPHPLISLPLLRSELSHLGISEVVDAYLADRQCWSAKVSPYVDSARFLLDGPWDGGSHPLDQIVRQHLISPWVRSDLLLIDSSDPHDVETKLAAAGVLLDRGAVRQGIATSVERWSEGELLLDSAPSAAEVVVAPGRFVGLSGVIRRLPGSASGLTADRTALVLSGEVLMLCIPKFEPQGCLLHLEGAIDAAGFRQALAHSTLDVAVSPSSRSQQRALELLVADEVVSRVKILPLDRQIRFRVERLILVPAAPDVADYADVQAQPRTITAATTAVVMSANEQGRVFSDRRIEPLLEAGARLCLVVEDDLGPWMNTLRRSRHILASRSVIDGVRLLCDPQNSILRVLSPEER